MRLVTIHNLTQPLAAPIKAGYCVSFLCRLRGLMFRRSLADREGLLLDEQKESRINAAIHMLFMRFDIAVIWIDNQQKVVDACLAKRWHLSYSPSKAARYTLETHPAYLSEFHAGDQLSIKE